MESSKVLLVGPVTSLGGYAANARANADILRYLGHDVKILSFDDYHTGYQPREDQAWYENSKYNPTGEWEPDFIFNSSNPIGFKPTIYPQICSTAWETDRVPARMGRPLETQQSIIVQSSFNVPAFREWHRDVRVVPLPVNTDIYRPTEVNDPSFDGFTFLAHGKWEYRKNFSNLVRTFNKTFGDNRKVRLLIKTHPFQVTIQEVAEIVAHNKGPSNVLLNPLDLPENQLNQLYNLADCFVLPTRGEGFGIPFLESMACGVPCIAPSIGGHTDFVRPENGFLVKSSMKQVIPHSVYDSTMKMVEPDLSSLSTQMRYAVDNPGELEKKGHQALLDAQEYSIPNVSKKLQPILEDVFCQ